MHESTRATCDDRWSDVIASCQHDFSRLPPPRLEAVLEAYALISHEHRMHHHAGLAAFLHRGTHVARAQRQVHNMIRDLLAKGAKAGEIRKDAAADELASYCLNALAGASSLPSKVAVGRLVKVALAGLRPPR